jgi:TetR/AcrR family transcriptional regulator
MLDQHNGDPQFLSFLRLVIGESGRFPSLARGFISQQVYQRAFQDVRDLFRRCPTAASSDPDQLAHVFIGSLVHQVLCQDLLHGREEIPLDREAFADGLLDLLCGEPARQRAEQP